MWVYKKNSDLWALMKSLFRLYVNAYSGLSPASWMLAFIMFVNRSGSMVLPFLTLYATQGLHYSLSEAGLLATVFGVGALFGSLLGGFLADRIGHFRVQFFSLILGGLWFFVVMFLRDLMVLCGGLFLLALITEMLRPANISSLSHYTKPENLTRSLALNRMAINLGFTIGPWLGGIAASIAFRWLFVVDGTTCIVAGIVFYLFFRKQKEYRKVHTDSAAIPKGRSPYRDPWFLLFLVCTFLFAILFFQLLFTLNPYYVEVRQLDKEEAGRLLALSGFIIFLVEMVVVYLVGDKIKLRWLIASGTLLTGISFVLLNLTSWKGILYISIVLLSLAEILAMPFMGTLVVKRSTPATRGKYMGMYSSAYSLAFIIGPLVGSWLADEYGFDVLWWAVGIASVPAALAFYFVAGRIEQATTTT